MCEKSKDANTSMCSGDGSQDEGAHSMPSHPPMTPLAGTVSGLLLEKEVGEDLAVAVAASGLADDDALSSARSASKSLQMAREWEFRDFTECEWVSRHTIQTSLCVCLCVCPCVCVRACGNGTLRQTVCLNVGELWRQACDFMCVSVVHLSSLYHLRHCRAEPSHDSIAC